VRILMIQPNYHAGGAEIAGNWPPGRALQFVELLRRGIAREGLEAAEHVATLEAVADPRVFEECLADVEVRNLRHRIPRPAQRLLRLLPRRIASRALVAAIRRNAWTFQGSGRLRVRAAPPAVFILEHCSICRHATATEPLCGYHAATFERLFRELVDPTTRHRDLLRRHQWRELRLRGALGLRGSAIR
jgi:hypothetical protein